MVDDFEIFVGTHRTATIVFFLADDMNLTHVERVGGTHDRADIEIMFDVFNGDFEAGTFFAQCIKNLFVGQAFIFVDKVSCIFHL